MKAVRSLRDFELALERTRLVVFAVVVVDFAGVEKFEELDERFERDDGVIVSNVLLTKAPPLLVSAESRLSGLITLERTALSDLAFQLPMQSVAELYSL